MRDTMHLRPGAAKQPYLELKTRPKQLLGSLPLVIALPSLACDTYHCGDNSHRLAHTARVLIGQYAKLVCINKKGFLA